MAQGSSQPSPNSQIRGLEQRDGGDSPMLPIEQTDGVVLYDEELAGSSPPPSNSRVVGIEQHDDDDSPPLPLTQMDYDLCSEELAAAKAGNRTGGVELMDDGDPPQEEPDAENVGFSSCINQGSFSESFIEAIADFYHRQTDEIALGGSNTGSHSISDGEPLPFSF